MKHKLNITIGNDLGLNYYRSFIKVPKFQLILTYLFLAKTATNLWEKFINEHFITLSPKNWEMIIWRDKKMGEVVKADQFLFVSNKEYAKLIISRGISKHIYYVKGKYKRLTKKWVLNLMSKLNIRKSFS